jgi:hypothetical protein
MERESFENPEIAGFLNAHFVSVKVDREERPDVDKIYMTFVQATTGQGGWPMSVFLTADRKPFFGGTYFPPEDRHGRPGFLRILDHIRRLWETRREEVAASAVRLHSQLAQAAAEAAAGNEGNVPNQEALRHAGELLKLSYDAACGGFGQAPKFPHPAQPQFLLRYARRFQDNEARQMVLDTCDRMAAGGIHDQLGGGFARYSVDRQWLVPHFEKMLYDNAQLAQLYLDAFLVSGEPRHAETVRDILGYVLRDMTHAEGGFYSAEDADSEGQEGRFYCWTAKEMAGLLTPGEYKVAARFYGVTVEGNFIDHSHPAPLPNLNVLSVADPNLSPAEAKLLRSVRAKLLAARARRVRPHLDDKVLTSWNGLMLGALARASVILDDLQYLAAARRNLSFLQSALWDSATRTLFHRWRAGQRDQVQLLEAYALLLGGVTDWYEATLSAPDLDFAIQLAEGMIRVFHDRENGGFWQSPAGATDLILRVKDDYDGAEPSGNAMAILGLLRLGRITGRQDFIGAAEKSLGLFSRRLRNLPQAVPAMLQALDFWIEAPIRVVLAGDPQTPGARALLRAAHSVYQPAKVVLGNLGAVEPFAKTLQTTRPPQVYICTRASCQPPTDDPARVIELLKG